MFLIHKRMLFSYCQGALEDFEKNKETSTPATKEICPDPVDDVWDEEFMAYGTCSSVYLIYVN
jgi:hypothetical protein